MRLYQRRAIKWPRGSRDGTRAAHPPYGDTCGRRASNLAHTAVEDDTAGLQRGCVSLPLNEQSDRVARS